MVFSITEKITTNDFNVISGSLHIVFPLSSGQYIPLHNFIKMYKLSKMYTREGKWKFQSQKKMKQKTNRIPISIQITQKNLQISLAWEIRATFEQVKVGFLSVLSWSCWHEWKWFCWHRSTEHLNTFCWPAPLPARPALGIILPCDLTFSLSIYTRLNWKCQRSLRVFSHYRKQSSAQCGMGLLRTSGGGHGALNQTFASPHIMFTWEFEQG